MRPIALLVVLGALLAGCAGLPPPTRDPDPRAACDKNASEQTLHERLRCNRSGGI